MRRTSLQASRTGGKAVQAPFKVVWRRSTRGRRRDERGAAILGSEDGEAWWNMSGSVVSAPNRAQEVSGAARRSAMRRGPVVRAGGGSKAMTVHSVQMQPEEQRHGTVK